MSTDAIAINEPTPQEVIHAALCARILSGKLAPGAQLPTVLALKEEFGVAVLTMQRALERLKNDGFTLAVRGKGTYVNPEAPCLKRIGVVFPALRGGEKWSLLYEAILLAAESQGAELGLEIVPYYGQGSIIDQVEHARLIDDIKWCRLAGILFAVHPFELKGTLAMAPRLPMPRVAVMSGAGYPDISSIYPDLHAFGQAAAKELADRGCRSSSCISTINWPRANMDILLDSLQENGIKVPSRWVQAVPHQDPRWARNCAHQLFASDHTEIPESLIITDDHLVEACLDGVRDAGRAPGKDVHIIAYRNHPSPRPMMDGVAYLGADLSVLFQQALQTMEYKRKGKPFARDIALPAVFQDTSHTQQG